MEILKGVIGKSKSIIGSGLVLGYPLNAIGWLVQAVEMHQFYWQNYWNNRKTTVKNKMLA